MKINLSTHVALATVCSKAMCFFSHCLWGVCDWSLFCCAVLGVISRFAFTSTGEDIACCFTFIVFFVSLGCGLVCSE